MVEVLEEVVEEIVEEVDEERVIRLVNVEEDVDLILDAGPMDL